MTIVLQYASWNSGKKLQYKEETPEALGEHAKTQGRAWIQTSTTEEHTTINDRILRTTSPQLEGQISWMKMFLVLPILLQKN